MLLVGLSLYIIYYIYTNDSSDSSKWLCTLIFPSLHRPGLMNTFKKTIRVFSTLFRYGFMHFKCLFLSYLNDIYICLLFFNSFTLYVIYLFLHMSIFLFYFSFAFSLLIFIVSFQDELGDKSREISLLTLPD